MKNKFFGWSFLAASMLALGLTSCQNEEFVNETAGDQAEIVSVVATASVNAGPESRTNKTEGADELEFTWAANDKLAVFSENGARCLGILTLKGEGNQATGEFEGKLSMYKTDSRVNIFYLGQQMADKLTELSVSCDFDLSMQNGAITSLTDFDIMHGQADVERSNTGNATFRFELASILSFAHFYAHMPEGVAPTNEKVTFSGSNVFNKFTLNFADGSIENTGAGNIVVNPVWETGASNEGDFYMAVVPGETDTELSIAVGEKTYKATLDSRNYGANRIFCGGTAHGKDVYFSENGEWTVTYIDYGDASDKKDVTKIGYGPSMTFKIVKDPVKAGYKFMGWSDEENGAVNPAYIYKADLTLNRPNTEKTLYSVWEEEWKYKKYSLTYKDGITVTQYYSSKTETPWIFYCEESDNIDYTAPEGYILLGWADEEGAKEAKYTVGSKISTGGKDIQEKTVYPVLKKKSSEGTITAPGSTGTGY